ncbi:MAG: cation:proton antiporter, partial [Candidatus Rokuibacteriota bacterium]
ADPIFFRDLAYVFLAAVVGGGLAWLARQPLILGYVFGGILISPLTPGPAVTDVHTFELFAEIGVILLMFSIGVEFSLRDLMRVKWVAVLGGPLGIFLSIGLGLGVGTLLGWTALEGIIVGIVVSVASTMVLARLLLDRGELHSRHGRIMIGITLVEDLAVVVLIVLIPEFGAMDGGRILAIAEALGIAAAILVPFFYLAAKVVPPILTRVARTRSHELFLLVSLAIALGTAALTQAMGLSLALGAFLAGLLISESDYGHEILARLLALRDAFVALFFVTVGALVDPRSVVENLPLLGTMVGLIVAGKLAIWTTVVLLFGHPLWTALLVGVGLTQIGEFSFILIQVAHSSGHVGADFYTATLAAALITILINAALVRYVPRWVGRARLARSALQAPPPGDDGVKEHVVICGFGRVGSAVAEALQTFNTPYVAIEMDPDIVKSLRAGGVPALYGDAAEARILESAGAHRAALAVVAVPDVQAAEGAVRHLHLLNPDLPILARAHTPAARSRLIEAGASEVIQPELEAASTLIRHSLRRLALPRERVLAYVERFRGAMDEAMTAVPAVAGDALPDVGEVTVDVAGLADQSLREARIRERFGVTVLSIKREDGQLILHPSADTVFRPGDRVRVFGLPEQIATFVYHARPPDAEKEAQA